jgi:retinaldehyde-binding protein 1
MFFKSRKKDEGVAALDPETGKVLEDDIIRANGLMKLRERISQALAKDPSIRIPRSDDRFLLAFLRARKYRVDKAFDVLLNFSKFWYDPENKEMIEGLCAERVRDVWSLGMMGFLPETRDIYGNSVVILRMGNVDFGNEAFKKHYTAKNMLSLSLYTLAWMFASDEMQLHGSCYVETLEGFTFSNAMKLSGLMSGADQKKMMAAGADTFPMRIRDIYVIHQPWYFSTFWAIVKPFLKEKITKRLHILGKDVSALHKFVDPAGLPSDFGGQRSVDLSAFLDELEKVEKQKWNIGGFAIPFSVEDPTGEKRGIQSAEMSADSVQHASSSSSSTTTTTEW